MRRKGEAVECDLQLGFESIRLGREGIDYFYSHRLIGLLPPSCENSSLMYWFID